MRIQHPAIQHLRRVSKLRGIGMPRLLAGYVGCRRRNPTLGITDYLACKLFDKAFTAGAQPEDFLGWRVETDLALALNPRTVVLPAWDKLTFAMFAKVFELPAPELVAAYRRGPLASSTVAGTFLRSIDDLGRWLRSNDIWPLFAKPSYSQQSVGCFHFTGYRPATEALLTPSGEEVPLERFLRAVEGTTGIKYFQPEMGYLFQEVLKPHPQIVGLLGTRQISGLRVVLIQDDQGVEIVSALWKLAGGETDTDRFEPAYPKTLIADIAPDSGTLRMAVSMTGRAAQAPHTGAKLEGFVLPDWERVTELCARAATLFPMMRIQHWDVALTDRGPRLLEVNDIGAIGWLQVFGHGIVTPRLRALLERHGDAAKYPWIARICR